MPHTSVRARPPALLAGQDHGDLDHQLTPTRAWLLILPAYLCFSLLDASAKWLVLAGFAPLFVVWCRYIGHVLFILVYLRSWEHTDTLRTVHPWLQIIRGTLLATGTLCNFLALQTLQLAETMAIFLASPMLITALSGPLLGEWAGWRRWLAVCVGFAGVLVVVRPGTDAFQFGMVYSLVALVATALYFIMTRRMTETESDESMIVYGGLAPAIVLLPALFLQGEWPGFTIELALLLAIGAFGAVGHLFVIKAHRIAPAPSIAPAVFTQVIWMTALGWLVFAQLPDGWTMAGIAIIVASGLYILNRERLLAAELDGDSLEDAPASAVVDAGRE